MGAPMGRYLKTVYTVYGTSYRGNTTKRGGKAITCGHDHDTREEALSCQTRMKAERPGHCQDYQIAELEIWAQKRTNE